MSLNKVMLIGRLGDDIKLTTFEGGGVIGNVSLATDESYKDKDGNKVEKTEWHRLSIRNKTAEIMAQYLKKGDEVYVEGKNATRKYTDANGVEKYTTEVVVFSFSFVGNKTNDNVQQSQSVTKDPMVGSGVKDDDEPPF